MSQSSDRSWISRFLSMGLRHDQLYGAVRSGSMQQVAYVRQLLKETKQNRLDLETPLDDITFIILDTETTGFHPNTDEIFAFSATKTMTGEQTATYSTLIKPNQPLSASIQELTGIDQKDVDQAPLMEEQIQPILDFLTTGILVGYHITHDLRFLNAYLNRRNQSKLPHQSFELRQLMEKAYRKSFPTLDDALSFLSIQCEARHSAEGDVAAMTLLWKQLYQHFKERQLSTLYDLYALVGT